MKCIVEYTNAKGRRVPVSVGNSPREFPNNEAARQFIRNHKHAYRDAERKPLTEK